MKVRIGIGSTGQVANPTTLEELCRELVACGFDSIWVSEVLSQPGLDPFVAMAWLAGRFESLKIGATFLVPGRNILRLARQLASLDVLSNGQLLLTAVPGVTQGGEATAVGVAQNERSLAIEEAIPVLRSLFAGIPTDVPSHAGITQGVVLDPLPIQRPLELWLGGTVHSSLLRCGRIGDGWLPALIDHDQARFGKSVIEEAASAVGRVVDAEHFGVSIGYATEPLSPQALALLRKRAKRDDLDAIVPVGHDHVRRLLESFIDVGFSKFVLRPLWSPTSWGRELEDLARVVGDLQT
jgi:probable F420-dependent oxidoreductase